MSNHLFQSGVSRAKRFMLVSDPTLDLNYFCVIGLFPHCAALAVETLDYVLLNCSHSALCLLEFLSIVMRNSTTRRA